MYNNTLPTILNVTVPTVTGQIGFTIGNIRPIISNQLSVLLSRGSTKNGIRKYLYSICSSIPQVFNNLVELVCYTSIPILLANNNNQQVVIQHMVGIIDKVSASIASEMPNLIDFQLTEQDKVNALSAANEIYELINKTTSYINTISLGLTNQAPMYQQPMVNNFNNTPMVNTMYNQPNVQMQQTPIRLATNNQPSTITGNDRYANRVQNTQLTYQAPQVQQPVVTQQPVPQIPQENTGETIVSEDNWVPTVNNPYRTLITNKQQRYYIIKDGVVLERIKQNKGDTSVDREQHMLVKSGTTFDQSNTNAKIEKLSNQTFDIVKALKLKESNNPEVVKTADLTIKNVLDDITSITSTIEEGIMETKVAYLAKCSKNKDTFFTKQVYVTNTYPSLLDMTYLTQAISKAHTYASIADIVNNEIEAITKSTESDDDKVDRLMFVDKVNRLLTDVINEFLLMGLGSSVRIGSLTEDAYSIEPFISESLGQTYSGSYLRWEEDTLPGIFKLENNDIPNCIKDSYLDNDTNSNIKFNILLEKYTVTFINLQLSETGFVLKPNVPYNITRTNTRYLYNIATYLYKDPSISNNKHLIVTSDNVILRIYKSYMSHDLYVATLVK